MKLKELCQIILSYKKAYRNYIFVLFMLYVKHRTSLVKDVNVNVYFKNNERLTVPYGWVSAFARLKNIENSNISDLKLTTEGLSFRYNENLVLIDPARMSDLDAVFFREDYKFLNVTNRDVIDVGMNIGDSAIYFSINGAMRVIGLEPYPYAFSFAEKNVKLNGINNITLLNAGYGKDSNIIVAQRKFSFNGSSLINSMEGREIQIISLKSLIKKYNLKNIVIKMDCEGCEYTLLDEEDAVFEKLEMIQIEYHYGYEELVKKLKRCGFDVKYTEPRKSYNPYAENTHMYIGFIYAKK